MKHITLKELFETAVNDVLENNNNRHNFYWKDGEDHYHEITEIDLLRGRFITENDDFSDFEWEIEDSKIYMENC